MENNTSNKDTLYIYVRVSTTKQSEKGYSLQAQINKGIEKAKELDMNYIVFKDAGISADTEDIENRPSLKKMLEMCDEGIVKNIFVTEFDRLSRNEYMSAYIKKIILANNVFIYMIRDKFDLHDSDDDFIQSIYSLLARRENTLRTTRSKRGIELAAKAGKWHGGILPYGYDSLKSSDPSENNKLVVNEEEAKYVRMMFDLSLKGLGSNKIAEKLNDWEVPTKGSKMYKKGYHVKDRFTKECRFVDKDHITWKGGTVLTILKNPIHKGEMHFKKQEIISVPAIIDKDKWEEVQNNLRANYNNSRRNNKYFYLLRGLLFCKNCNNRLYGLIKPSRGMRQYVCMSKRPNPHKRFCGLRSINKDKLEDIIWKDLIFQISSNTGIIEKAKKFLNDDKTKSSILNKIKSLENKINEKETQRERLLKLYVNNISFTETELNDHANKINDDINNLKNEINSLKNKLNIINKKNKAIEDLENIKTDIIKISNSCTEIQKREIVMKMINKIIIGWSESKGHSVEVIYRIPFSEKNLPVGIL